MEGLGNSVQRKISCIFQTEVVEESSKKHSHQSYKVIATENIKDSAIKADVFSAKPSEKFDGTCCYIQKYKDDMWLWARLDRKPGKGAEKRFKKYQAQERAWQLSKDLNKAEKPNFTWDLTKDFKIVPDNWIPALGVQINEDGKALPDDIGHTPGWVPVDPTSRQHCWHLQCVDFEHSLILVLRNASRDVDSHLEVVMVPMIDYIGKTMELIGTNVNGNPYKIGTKEKPVHILVPHGEIGFHSTPPLSFCELRQWFDSTDGQVEGIVWHSTNGEMFKCHRHHLGLKWPVENVKLNSQPLIVNINTSDKAIMLKENSLFEKLAIYNGKSLQSVCNLTY